MKTVYESVYNHPKYYDVLFNAEWRQEIEFLEACFQRHADRRVKRVFEPACGTGRLLSKLADRGYQVAGNDLNPNAVNYCNDRLRRAGHLATVVEGDMADFGLRPKTDAAFNLINSFRHLPTEALAEAHLRCVAESLRKGGIYVLGLHLTPPGEPLCDEESWSARRGTLLVESNMTVERWDRRKREEHILFTLRIKTPSRRLRIVDRFVFRTYSVAQITRLFDRIKSLELIDIHDFSLCADDSIQLDRETEDAVFILRKT